MNMINELGELVPAIAPKSDNGDYTINGKKLSDAPKRSLLIMVKKRKLEVAYQRDLLGQGEGSKTKWEAMKRDFDELTKEIERRK